MDHALISVSLLVTMVAILWSQVRKADRVWRGAANSDHLKNQAEMAEVAQRHDMQKALNQHQHELEMARYYADLEIKREERRKG